MDAETKKEQKEMVMIVKCIRSSKFKFHFVAPPNIITNTKQIDIYITWKGLVPFAYLIKNHSPFADEMQSYKRFFWYDGEILKETWIENGIEKTRNTIIKQSDMEDFLPVIQEVIDKYFVEIEVERNEKRKMKISNSQKERYMKKGK